MSRRAPGPRRPVRKRRCVHGRPFGFPFFLPPPTSPSPFPLALRAQSSLYLIQLIRIFNFPNYVFRSVTPYI